MIYNELLDYTFAPIVNHWFIVNEFSGRLGSELKLVIEFINGSSLRVFECTYYDTGNFRYGYQWMNEQNQTIFRWDNTPHFPQFDTFPAHRHVGAQEMGEPFAAVSLEDVLLFIASQLNP